MIGLRFVEMSRSRHGKVAYYFRRSKTELRIRLPDINSPNFHIAYDAAIKGAEPVVVPTAVEAVDISMKQRVEICASFSMTRAKKRARAKGLEFDLDREWLRCTLGNNGYRCALTGIAFDMTARLGKVRPYARRLIG